MRKYILAVFAIGIFVTYYLLDSKSEINEAITVVEPEIMQGKIIIQNVDVSGFPIQDAEYTITNDNSSVIVESIITDSTGKASSGLLDYGVTYTVRQRSVPSPYQLNPSEIRVVMDSPIRELTDTNSLPEYVREIERSIDGKVKIKKVYMDVDTLMQKPELPNGCEIVSLTAVLNFYGFPISKTEMADHYLPKEPFSIKDKKLFGPDPYKAYSGNPRNLKGAFFTYAPPIVEAAKSYFKAIAEDRNAIDISGSSREQIMNQLDQGIPVIIWTTLDLSKPKINNGWYLQDTGKYFPAPVNLHVVVLNGYEDNFVHVMNPLKGQVKYNADSFFKSYEEMGKHALIVDRSSM